MPFIVACALFLFLEGRRRKSVRRQEETQARQATRGNASPSGGKRRRKSVRRKGETRPR